MTSSAIRRSLFCFLLLLLVRNLCAEMTTPSEKPDDQKLVADAHEEIKELPYVENEARNELTLTLKKGEKRATVPLTVQYLDKGLGKNSTFIALRPSPECIGDFTSVLFRFGEMENKERCYFLLKWTQDGCSLSINNNPEELKVVTRNELGKHENVAVHIEDDPAQTRCINFKRYHSGASMRCLEASDQPCSLKSPMNFTMESIGDCEFTVLFYKEYHSLYVPPVTTSRVSEEPSIYEAKHIEKRPLVKVEEDKGVAGWVWALVGMLVLVVIVIAGLAFHYFCIYRREDKELAALGIIEAEQSNPITAVETGYENKLAKSRHDPPSVVKKPANKSKHSILKSNRSVRTAIPNYQPPDVGTGLPAGYTPPPN